MPQIGENLILASTQPNFSRDRVRTILDLKNAKIKHYDIGHIVYCVEDDKHYIFKGDQVEDDDKYGHFRAFFDSIDSISSIKYNDIDEIFDSLSEINSNKSSEI